MNTSSINPSKLRGNLTKITKHYINFQVVVKDSIENYTFAAFDLLLSICSIPSATRMAGLDLYMRQNDI
jgi:hypothetical protein